MDNNLEIFKNDDLGTVRTFVKDKEIWFVAKDICDVLGLTDTSKTLERLDNDEKGTNTIRTPGGEQKLLTVNEPGMYNLVLKSRKPNAKKFKRWLTHDVIPSIREKGFYVTNTESPQNQFDFLRSMIDRMEENADKSEKALLTAQSTQETLNDIQSLLATNPKDWRDWVNSQFNSICKSPSEYGVRRSNSYIILEKRAGCNLKTRLKNMKKRALENGATKTKANKLNYLDVISQDKKLKEIYISVVKELKARAA
ncbi:MAG: Bro-N domain-containing protein [Halanaerobiales bacterium]